MKRRMPYTEVTGYFEYEGKKIPTTQNIYPFGASGWMFTTEEIERLLEQFTCVSRTGKKKDLPSNENLAKFFFFMEYYCSAKKYFLIDYPTKEVVKNNREKVLSDCKAALGHLHRIKKCDLRICRYESLEAFDENSVAAIEDGIADFTLESWGKADKAIETLESFIQTLEQYHSSEEEREKKELAEKNKQKPGRGTANNDYFVSQIAKVYTKFIGTPSAYKEGTFFRIVKTLFEILEMPSVDPTRSIRAALK